MESHYADLPGLRMHYAAAGPAGGKPVLLLHGFPEFWYCWHNQLSALADAGYRCIAPDQRGYNLTGKSGPFSIATLTQDLRALLDFLEVDHCFVVAHDFGAPPAYTLAWMYPERVEKLAILNGPHPNAFLDTLKRRPSQWLRSWYMAFFQIPWLPERLFRSNDFAALEKAYADLPRETKDEDVARFKEAFAQPGALSATIGWYRALIRGFVAHGGPSRRDISIPTCIVWGDRDKELGQHINDTLDRYLSNFEIHHIPEAGHFVQMEAPGEVNAILLKFFGGENDGPAARKGVADA